MLKEMNLGLVRMNESGNQIIGSQYMLSKWERNLGDTLTINGVAVSYTHLTLPTKA